MALDKNNEGSKGSQWNPSLYEPSIQKQSCQYKMTKYPHSPSKEVEMEVIAQGANRPLFKPGSCLVS